MVFLPPDKLSQQKLDFILPELEEIISGMARQKDNVKLKSFGLFTVAKKSDVQDLLDSILKIAYPYISQARKLSDMNKQLEYSRSGASLKFSLLPEALPMGYEDKTPVIVGFHTNKNGQKSVVKVNVWRSLKFVWYERKDAKFYKPITSESAPVDMEDAKSGHPGPFTLSATGRAAEKWPWFLGDYNLTEEEHSGRPVYRNSKGRPLYATDGGWEVGFRVGDSIPYLRSTSPAPSPALCQHWQYSDSVLGRAPWIDGDITVTVKK